MRTAPAGRIHDATATPRPAGDASPTTRNASWRRQTLRIASFLSRQFSWVEAFPQVGRTGFEPVTHGLKALHSIRIDLRKRSLVGFRDTSATQSRSDISVTTMESGEGTFPPGHTLAPKGLEGAEPSAPSSDDSNLGGHPSCQRPAATPTMLLIVRPRRAAVKYRRLLDQPYCPPDSASPSPR
jgi:hypothetical protein